MSTDREDASQAVPPVPAGELGQGVIEYALIIFLVAIVVIAILLLLGPQIGAVFSRIYETI
jgi:pilus assembly protein Flp/PilA